MTVRRMVFALGLNTKRQKEKKITQRRRVRREVQSLTSAIKRVCGEFGLASKSVRRLDWACAAAVENEWREC